MYEILINVLVFCAILLLIALTVAVVQGVIILLDINRMVREIKKKLIALASLFDIFTILFGGFEGIKKTFKKKALNDKPTLIASIAGVKKGLQVLFNK